MEKLSLNLNHLTKDDLRDLAESMGERLPASWKKARMIERMGEIFLEKPDIVLDMLSGDTIDELQRHADRLSHDPDKTISYALKDTQKQTLVALIQMSELGLIKLETYGDNNIVFKAALSDYCLELAELSRTRGERIRQLEEIEKCVAGILITYGLIELDRLLSLLGNFFDGMSRDQLSSVIHRRLQLIKGCGRIEEEDTGKKWWYSRMMDDPEEWVDWYLSQRDIRYRSFEKSEFIRAAERGFMGPEDKFNSLKQIIIENGTDPDEADDIVTEMVEDIQSENGEPNDRNPLHEVTWRSDQTLRKALDAFVELCNAWPRWILFGYTPDEKVAMTRGKTVRSPAKPGRNELCPCGSGKKYKQCCGKLVN